MTLWLKDVSEIKFYFATVYSSILNIKTIISEKKNQVWEIYIIIALFFK